MHVKPGDVWLSVDCHHCGDLILVGEVPSDGSRSDWLAIFSELQPAKCPHCQKSSRYQLDETRALLAEQSH